MKLGREAERNLKGIISMATSTSWGHKTAMPTHQEPSNERLEKPKGTERCSLAIGGSSSSHEIFGFFIATPVA